MLSFHPTPPLPLLEFQPSGSYYKQFMISVSWAPRARGSFHSSIIDSISVVPTDLLPSFTWGLLSPLHHFRAPPWLPHSPQMLLTYRKGLKGCFQLPTAAPQLFLVFLSLSLLLTHLSLRLIPWEYFIVWLTWLFKPVSYNELRLFLVFLFLFFNINSSELNILGYIYYYIIYYIIAHLWEYR